MKDNLSKLKKITSILEIKRIILTKGLIERLGPNSKKSAISNNNKIFAYKMVYKSKSKKIIGYIVEPRIGKNLSCIIWNRGGSRDFGSIKLGSLFIDQTLIAPLAIQGHIVIMTQYPGVAGGEGIDKWGDQEGLASILNLQKILKNYKRANHTKIGMYGHSRGGTMTYMCLKKVKWIKAAVISSAPSNEIRASIWRKGWKDHQNKIYGGSIKEKKKRSALFWTDKLPKKTPILLLHGTSDWKVNPLDSINMAEKLYQNKIPYRLVIYEGDDHGMSNNKQDYQKQVLDWFKRFLIDNEKLPDMKPHGR